MTTEPIEVKADLEVVAELATLAAELRPVALGTEGALGVLIPKESTLKVLEADRFTEFPSRKTGTIELATAQALMDYVTRHQTDGTELYINTDDGVVIAVLDDHGVDHAGRGLHRARLDLEKTPEWITWTGMDTKLVHQTTFAEFIQDNGTEILKPAPARMLEVASTFRAKHKVNFRSATNLTNGDLQVQYDESTDANAGKRGELTIPTEFELGIAPFIGEKAYKVKARLRWRLNGSELTIGYKLERPDAIVRDALTAVADRLAETFPNVFLGTPRGHG